jgi:hypothetical protein
MRPLTVSVNEKCIEWGIQRDDAGCPVWMGISEADENLRRVTVNAKFIKASHITEQTRYIWKTPKVVQDFLAIFDRDKAAVRPFTFSLDPRYAEQYPMRKAGATERIIEKTRRPAVRTVKATQRPLVDQPAQ